MKTLLTTLRLLLALIVGGILSLSFLFPACVSFAHQVYVLYEVPPAGFWALLLAFGGLLGTGILGCIVLAVESAILGVLFFWPDVWSSICPAPSAAKYVGARVHAKFTRQHPPEPAAQV